MSILAFFRKFFTLIFWWLVVIACILFIGYIAWPLLGEKFSSMCTNPNWEFCRGDWGDVATADEVQKTIENKSTSFFHIVKTAISDILSDDGGKKQVEYIMSSETGRYEPILKKE